MNFTLEPSSIPSIAVIASVANLWEAALTAINLIKQCGKAKGPDWLGKNVYSSFDIVLLS